jgi:hypothetical protein
MLSISTAAFQAAQQILGFACGTHDRTVGASVPDSRRGDQQEMSAMMPDSDFQP